MISPEGERNTYALFDSIVRAAGITSSNSGPSMLVESLRRTSSDWTIEFSPDTIWRTEKDNGRFLKKELVDRKEGVVTSFTKDIVPRVIYINKILSIEDKESIQLKEIKKERKRILGYDCYKVVWEKSGEKGPDNHFDLGNSVIEMFVTDKIDIPSFSLFELPKELAFFPLEIKISMTKVAGVYEMYEVKEIIPKKKK